MGGGGQGLGLPEAVHRRGLVRLLQIAVKIDQEGLGSQNVHQARGSPAALLVSRGVVGHDARLHVRHQTIQKGRPVALGGLGCTQ